MMTIGQIGQTTPAAITPVVRQTDQPEPSISGSQIFITLLLTLLGGAIGYALGYERATGKVMPRSGSGGSYRSYT